MRLSSTYRTSSSRVLLMAGILFISGVQSERLLGADHSDSSNPDQIEIYGVQSECPFAQATEPLSCRVLADVFPHRALNYRLDESPPGMEIDAITGVLKWTPTLQDLGQHRVTVTVSDGVRATATNVGMIRVSLPSPKNLSAVLISEGVKITWSPVLGAISYRIRWLYSGEGIAEVADVEYLFRGILPAGREFFVVNAVDHRGERSADTWIPVPNDLTRVMGNWLTQSKDGIIQISQAADGTLLGRIVGGNKTGVLDIKNPDPLKRTLALRGQVIMSGLKYDGRSKWSGGKIYKPDEGKSYKCKVELQADDTLKVRGFIGVSLFGKSQIWTRYTGTLMDLPKSPDKP